MKNLLIKSSLSYLSSFFNYFNKLKQICLLLLTLLFIPLSLQGADVTLTASAPVEKDEGHSGTTSFTFPIDTASSMKEGTLTYEIVLISGEAEGSDFIKTTYSATVNKHSTAITVEIKGDADPENNEAFKVNLVSITDGSVDTAQSDGIILNDDIIVYLLKGEYIQVGESVGTAQLEISVVPPIDNDTIITVDFNTVDGTAKTTTSDYTSTSGNLEFDSSLAVHTIDIGIIDDAEVESTEDLSVILSNENISTSLGHLVSISATPGTVDILDNDGVSNPILSIGDSIANENSQIMIFTVSLSNIITEDVTFSYATSEGTAKYNEDFVEKSGIGTIAANTKHAYISIDIIDDAEAGELQEQFFLSISTTELHVTLGDDKAIGIINDDDTGLTLSIYNTFIKETDVNQTLDLNVSFSKALTADLNLTYSTSDGSATSPEDYNGTSKSIIIPSGSTSHLLPFTIVGDALKEGLEYFNVHIDDVVTSEAIVLARDLSKVTILDDDAEAGCSSHIGLLTLNEYHHQIFYWEDIGGNALKIDGNFVEIKFIDLLARQYIDPSWTITLYNKSGGYVTHKTWDQRDPECTDPRYEVFDFDNQYVAKDGYVVFSEGAGATLKSIDALNIMQSTAPSTQQCQNFAYDTTFDEGGAQNKNIYREPDGTGDWFDNGNGSNSLGSRCRNKDGESEGLHFTIFDAVDTDELVSFPVIGGFSVPIKTKVVNEPFKLDILSLNPETGDLNATTIKVRTYLANGITGDKLTGPNPPVPVTFSNQSVIDDVPYTYPLAEKIVRLRFEYCGNDSGGYDDYDQCWKGASTTPVEKANQRFSHSRNAFSIRPEKFTIDEGSISDYPNLFRAGLDYKFTLEAHKANGTELEYLAKDYNQTKDNIELDEKRFHNDDSDDDGSLFGELTWSPSTSFVMEDGISTQAGANNVAGLQYSDVGMINILIRDKNWAAIDNDDTPEDCDSNFHTWICEDTPDVITFIPHHFRVDNIHLRDHGDGNFTYLSNDLNMSAHIDANISAMNANDDPTVDINTSHITKNFHQGALYYENPVSVDLNVTEWLGVASRHSKGNSVHKHDIPTEKLLGFGGSDADGTHLIPWNETNTTQQLMFNYTRQNNQTVNPFEVAGTDINISLQSTYTDGSTLSSPAIITGSGIGDRNATFYYGRAKSSQFFYDDIEASSVQTPISVVVYCDTFPTCSELEDNEIEIGIPNWWLSANHNENDADGNITLIIGDITPTSGSATVDTDVNIANGIDGSITVTRTSDVTLLPLLVEIDLDTSSSTTTNTWLIYNSESPITDPDPFYKVRFIGVSSSWTGVGETGYVVDINASKVKSKRMDW